ncbi:MAG: hypothetical protein D3924_20595, partial [Candidatus Electrothrix sp. AR4]|nr:hypothetical protein [Candidatus Electrothrix sp. AR4]
LGLYAPEEIFPSRAVTKEDYRCVLFSEIKEIDNVWPEPLAGAETPYCGLYRILVSPGATVGAGKKAAQELKDKITEVYARHRTLCEDVGNRLASSGALSTEGDGTD